MGFSGVCPNEGVLSSSNNFSSSKRAKLVSEWKLCSAKISQFSNIHYVKFLASSRSKDLLVTHTLCFKQWSHYMWTMHGDWTNTRKYFSLGKKANIYVCRRRKATNSCFLWKDEKKPTVLGLLWINLPLGSKLFLRVQVIKGAGLPSAL